MRNWMSGLVMALAAAASTANQPDGPARSLPSPEASPGHPHAGFWKRGSCDDEFGLSISPAGPGMYSVSFCGPGGCFEPGTYRPNTPIVGDPEYQVINSNTLGISTKDGSYQPFSRCPDGP
jgi:hypothetical protein